MTPSVVQSNPKAESTEKTGLLNGPAYSFIRAIRLKLIKQPMTSANTVVSLFIYRNWLMCLIAGGESQSARQIIIKERMFVLLPS
jgi:hypothetical protein